MVRSSGGWGRCHFGKFSAGSYRGTAPTQTLTDRGYTGQRENLDLGLMYYNARYYIPGIGKFASADTLVPDPANPQAFNRYSYVLNNPIRNSDPTGHMCYNHTAGPELFGMCIDENGKIYPVKPTHRDLAIYALRNKFVKPFKGTQNLTSVFGPSHDTGVDWGGEFSVYAPADGIVVFAGSDGTAGIWRIQNIETGEIREWSPFSSQTHRPLLTNDRDQNGLVLPELATYHFED